ncbi:integrin beta-PS [Penaeus vannamei]|uniref:integrin beta-PS n=1 Tax=Penaeus vannamei TaxID=6689 RepID=UPI00387F43D2
MRPPLLVFCLASLPFCLAADVPGCQHDSCTTCIRHPTCVWCYEPNNRTARPRCRSRERADFPAVCHGEKSDPQNAYGVARDEPLSADGDVENILQMSPQEVNLTVRIKETFNISLTYKHMANYPADIYYMMDGSKSMADDKDMLHSVGKELAEGMKKITSNLQLGFGIFVDKPVLPYVSTMSKNEAAYSFKNVLPLTSNTSAFTEEVKRAEGATNQDFPEGGFDGLMQAIVCEKDIKWRNASVRVIFFSTDAGFHFAGDGKLAGIVTPNDERCHLDGNELRKAHLYDFPSVAQINKMAKLHRINLVFAITAEQEPLYARLSQHIEGATSGVLASDSSNVVDLLTSSLKDIISKVELTQRDHNSHVSVRFFSECKDGEMKERSSCQGLDVGDEVQFEVEVTALKCPDNEKDWNPVVEVYPVGRQGSLQINLGMHCQCSCAKPGDKGYIVNAEACSRNGTSMCGVCECHEGFVGKACECYSNDDDGTGTISEDSCRQTNASAVCTDRGQCVCGQCQCKKPTDPSQEIYGHYCQCANYDCAAIGGKLCSGHGECDCNACNCNDGWTGKHCSCSQDTDNCENRDTGETCSNRGSCECNKCRCSGTYFGKWCEDCPTCSGKCLEFKPCIQCRVFQTGEFKDQCQEKCDRYNISIAKDLSIGEKPCSFLDEKDCRFDFAYEIDRDSGNVLLWAKQDLDCPEPVNTTGVIIGVIGAVLTVGVLALVLWKVCAVLHDRREYARFLRSKDQAKWSTNENPIFRRARTTIQNPLFNLFE